MTPTEREFYAKAGDAQPAGGTQDAIAWGIVKGLILFSLIAGAVWVIILVLGGHARAEEAIEKPPAPPEDPPAAAKSTAADSSAQADAEIRALIQAEKAKEQKRKEAKDKKLEQKADAEASTARHNQTLKYEEGSEGKFPPVASIYQQRKIEVHRVIDDSNALVKIRRFDQLRQVVGNQVALAGVWRYLGTKQFKYTNGESKTVSAIEFIEN